MSGSSDPKTGATKQIFLKCTFDQNSKPWILQFMAELAKPTLTVQEMTTIKVVTRLQHSIS